jgi:general secretion pathway protein E
MKAQESAPGRYRLPVLSQLVALGQQGQLDANDSHVVHIVDWLWQYVRATSVRHPSRAAAQLGVVRFRTDGVLHQSRDSRAGADCDDVADKARKDGDRRSGGSRTAGSRPSAGRAEIELRISTMPTFGEKS